MVFSSETFLFLFLPVFLAAYYLTPFRWQSLTILLFSWGFYGWWRYDFLGLLILSGRAEDRPRPAGQPAGQALADHRGHGMPPRPRGVQIP